MVTPALDASLEIATILGARPALAENPREQARSSGTA